MKKMVLINIITIVVLVVVGIVGFYLYHNATSFVTTDNAKLMENKFKSLAQLQVKLNLLM